MVLTRIFGFAANVLGIPVPQLYVRIDVPGALTHLPVHSQASIAGQTMLTLTPQDQLFVLGKHLADYRAELRSVNYKAPLTTVTLPHFCRSKTWLNSSDS